jgi:hypothetical protein
MGLLGGFIVYSFGKRRGRKQATRRLAQEYGAQPEPLGQQDCIHYWSFCKNYGSCDGMACEIGE